MNSIPHFIENIPGNCVNQNEVDQSFILDMNTNTYEGNYNYIYKGEDDLYHSIESCNGQYSIILNGTNLCLEFKKQELFLEVNEYTKSH